jgi:hypothetical protein
LPNVNIDSLTNDELVMKASEWVGKASSASLIMQSKNSNQWTGKGFVKMQRAEIIGNAEKYINLLAVRATSNTTLSLLYQDLRAKLDKNKKVGSRKTKNNASL